MANNDASVFAQERDQLKLMIVSAFAMIRHPGDDYLQASDALDEGEVADFRSDVAGADWRQVPQEVIDRNSQGLHSLSVAAYRFFLPAYLLQALDDSFFVRSNVFMFLLYELEGDGTRERRRRSMLSQQQRRAVRCFLEFVERHSDQSEDRDVAATALRHWTSVS